MSEGLEGQVALVIGAGRGIGRACAEGLADAGANVIAVARSEGDLAELSKHASGKIETWTADVTSDDFVERIETIDGLSVLVNNAGGNRPQPFVEVDTESLSHRLLHDQARNRGADQGDGRRARTQWHPRQHGRTDVCQNAADQADARRSRISGLRFRHDSAQETRNI